MLDLIVLVQWEIFTESGIFIEISNDPFCPGFKHASEITPLEYDIVFPVINVESTRAGLMSVVSGPQNSYRILTKSARRVPSLIIDPDIVTLPLLIFSSKE